MEELSKKLIETLELQTKAIYYLANVIGHKADDENPTDSAGKQEVKLDAVVTTKTETLEEDHKAVTFEHIKTAINMYAKKAGKEAALELVAKYAKGSKDIKAIDEADYNEFFIASEV